MAKFVCYLAILALLAMEQHVAHAAEVCLNPNQRGAVAGIVTCKGKPVARREVLAYDYDYDVNEPGKKDQLLGRAFTRSDGGYYIAYGKGKYGLEACPDIYIQVGRKFSPKSISNDNNSNSPPTFRDLDICA